MTIDKQFMLAYQRDLAEEFHPGLQAGMFKQHYSLLIFLSTVSVRLGQLENKPTVAGGATLIRALDRPYAYTSSRTVSAE